MRRSRGLCCLVFAVGLVLWLPGPLPSIANAHKARSGVVIACFHRKISRFTAEAHPRRCDIAGYRGEKFVEIPIKEMKWGHWGHNPTRAAFGVDTRNEIRVRVIAYRPIVCREGHAWYSRVVIVFPGNGRFSGLRLPTCDRHLPASAST